MSRGEFVECAIFALCLIGLGLMLGAALQHGPAQQSPADVVRGVEDVK